MRNFLFFTYLIIFLSAFDSIVYAQQRNVDLRIRVISHKDKDYIKSNGTITIKYSVFNKGSDKIFKNDSLYIYGSYYDSSFKPYPYIIPLPQDIAMNDSLVMTFSHSYSYPTDFNHFFISLTVQPINRSENGIVLENLEQQKDNRSIISNLKYRSPTSKIDDFNEIDLLRIFPNPANKIINFQFNEQIFPSKISILELSGKLIKNYPFEEFSNKKSISTDDLPNGIYFINYFINNVSLCTKLIVMH